MSHASTKSDRTALTAIWVEAAAKLGVRVRRGVGEAYVAYDGWNLDIADDAHLDDDDSVAQLIFHELCHGITQGEDHWRTRDWGLDNTKPGDEWRELAALRLQAHLLDGFGLRHVLHPTTPERAFYESLPRSPIAAGSTSESQSIVLARAAADRAAKQPYRIPLTHALQATVAFFELPLHPRTRLPVAPDETRTCGDCVWRTDGGFCRQAPSRVACRVDDRACVRHREVKQLDCLECGACCRAAYDAVYIGPKEKIIARHPELIGQNGFLYNLKRAGDRCAALSGPTEGPYACTVYDDRPKTCRDFEWGGRHCLDARRRIGLEAVAPEISED